MGPLPPCHLISKKRLSDADQPMASRSAARAVAFAEAADSAGGSHTKCYTFFTFFSRYESTMTEIVALRRHVHSRTVTYAVDVESVSQAVSEAVWTILAALIEPAIVSVLA